MFITECKRIESVGSKVAYEKVFHFYSAMVALVKCGHHGACVFDAKDGKNLDNKHTTRISCQSSFVFHFVMDSQLAWGSIRVHTVRWVLCQAHNPLQKREPFFLNKELLLLWNCGAHHVCDLSVNLIQLL